MKTQYKAIITSAVVVMLCLSAIGGVTYSWFSDSEQSEINITTGKIDLTITPGDVTVKSYGGSDKTTGTDGTITTDLNGKVTVSRTSGSSSALSISFENAAPGDVLSFELERSIVNSINVAYVESCQVSSGGKILSTHPFIINGIDTGKKIIGTNNTEFVIKDGTITIELDKNADSSEMGKSYSILLLFQAYQANAPISDITTTTIKSGDNVIGVNPESGLSSATTVSFDGTGMDNKDITLTAIDTADATYALSGSSPLAGISVNSDANFVGKDVNVSFVLSGNVSKEELTITHNGDTVWNGSTGTITVDATYDNTTDTTTVSFTTTLGFSYYAVYNTTAVAIGSNGSFYDSLKAAVDEASDGATITVLRDCDNQEKIQILDDKSITIDCNNHNITFLENHFAGVCTSNKSDLKYINGTLNVNAGGSFYAANGAKITIDNITVNVSGYGFFPCGNGTSISINNSIVNSEEFGIGTNAGNKSNYGVNISVINSTLISKDAPIMLNVTGNLTVKDSELIGGQQCLFLRAGTATVENTVMKFSEVNTITKEEMLTWGSNGEDGIPSAAIIVGNLTSTAYNDDAELTIKNSKVITKSDECITLIVAQDGNNGYGAKVTLDNSSSILGNAFKTTGNTLEPIDKSATEIEIPKIILS